MRSVETVNTEQSVGCHEDLLQFSGNGPKIEGDCGPRNKAWQDLPVMSDDARGGNCGLYHVAMSFSVASPTMA